MPDDLGRVKPRLEQDVILQEATVVLGGKARSFRVKTMTENRAFRRRLGEILGDIIGPMFDPALRDTGGVLNQPDVVRKVLPALMADGPEALMDLLWIYAPELKAFASESTDEEIIDAALEVLSLSFPLAQRIATQMIAFARRLGVSL